MASEKHYSGEAAVHMFATKLLRRGHNPARPLFDESPADDLYVAIRGKRRIVRTQVKSHKIKWQKRRALTTDLKISFPASILNTRTAIDVVAVLFWDHDNAFMGVFEPRDIRRWHESGGGWVLKRRPPHSPEIHFRAQIDARLDAKFTVGDFDVSENFLESGGRWDEIFPSRFSSK